MAKTKRLFISLLVLSEHRGPLGQWRGLATVCHRLLKAPLPALRFVTGSAYENWLERIPALAVLLMRHTCWPTLGSHLDNRNNHPLSERSRRAGSLSVLLTHNGNIPRVAQYFSRSGLPRRLDVDSEILLRLARRHAQVGGIDVAALLRDMARCESHLADMLAWATHQETVILIRRDRPNSLAFHVRRRLIATPRSPPFWKMLCRPARLDPAQHAQTSALTLLTDKWTMPQSHPFS